MANNGLLPLTLGARREDQQLFLLRQRDPAFAPFAEAVLIRDNYCCRFCGFKSRLRQAIVNIDGNYQHNQIANLAVACPFCCQSIFLGMASGQEPGGGKLIWMPEMTQGQLNSLVHMLFEVIYENNGGYGRAAQDLYRQLLARADYLVKSLKAAFWSDTSSMIRYLMNTSQEVQDNILAAMNKWVRLVPLYADFVEATAEWVKESQESLGVTTQPAG